MNRGVLAVVVLAGILSGCGPAPATSPAPIVTPPPFPSILTVMTHDSFSISASVLAEFESTHNAKLQFVKAGDAGTMLNKAILAKGNPLADVLYGVDNTYLSRALREGIFEAYASPLLADLPEDVRLVKAAPHLRHAQRGGGDV